MRENSQKVVLGLVLTYLIILIFQLTTFTIITGQIDLTTGRATSGTISLNISYDPPNAPLDLWAVLEPDNESVRLNWSDSFANSYTVYFSENLTSLKQINTGALTSDIGYVNYILDTNWTDINASQYPARYYRVAAVNGVYQNLTTKIGGKYDINVYAATTNPGEVEFNTISFPINPINKTIEHNMRWSSNQDLISIYNVTGSPPSYESAYYDGENWTGTLEKLEEGRGYLFGPVAQNYLFTIAGMVPEGNITTEVLIATLIPGEVELNLLGLNTPFEKCNFNSLIPTPEGIDVLSYYNVNVTPPQYDSAFYYYGNWYGDFNCLEVGRGYLFGPVASAYNWTYDRS